MNSWWAKIGGLLVAAVVAALVTYYFSGRSFESRLGTYESQVTRNVDAITMLRADAAAAGQDRRELAKAVNELTATLSSLKPLPATMAELTRVVTDLRIEVARMRQ